MANNESSVRIIPFYAHPHVHSVIKDDTFYDETVATPKDPSDLPFSTCVVTGADQGIDNTFVRISDADTKKAIFGKGNFQKYGQSSIQADALFNGSTNVWFCRVLPDNATYANVVVLAHYRKGNILDDQGQETGKVRLEIKFSLAYANKPTITEGAKSDNDILEFARSLASKTADPQTGYMTTPICYIRSIGRGKYGNNYAISINRDSNAEKEYSMKMYNFTLIETSPVTRPKNQFTGSLYQTVRYSMSTLISDVLDQWSTGSCPISIHSFEDGFQEIYDFYKDEIVASNASYILSSGADVDEIAELQEAQKIVEDTFDPLFGIKMNTRTNELIPYYRNYTVSSDGAWVAPDLEVPAITGVKFIKKAKAADAPDIGEVEVPWPGDDDDPPAITGKPLNISDWNNAFVGARVLVCADPLNDGQRWLYTVTSIDPDTGNIIYDEGVATAIDADQYDGVNIAQAVGQQLSGGHDGDFQEISVNGETRAPSAAEMKLLLSREFVKAFRGQKDRKILSPARVNLDFMFDANYNMTSDDELMIDTINNSMYSGSTVLTDQDAQNLAILGTNGLLLDFTDLNVKKAMYDLNEFRNRNGMTINPEEGAGCHLHLDCNIIGLKSVGINYELIDIINMMEPFDGRCCSIDLGYYEIFDPVTGKRITVTATYFLAKKLIPHLLLNGLNKPFTFNYAQLTAIQRDRTLTVSGDMIRDTFRPDIDLIDWDVKERLYNARINYYLTTDEGRIVKRAVQNTRQREASCLLEENNCRVLNTLKKGLEKASQGYLYEWNEPEARKGYTQAQMEIYRPWIGTMVQDLDIYFSADEWEQERMIMHCYVKVAFRDIAKRIVLEIGIRRANYSGGES